MQLVVLCITLAYLCGNGQNWVLDGDFEDRITKDVQAFVEKIRSGINRSGKGFTPFKYERLM